jgi:nucleotide-binding universal stress UspA family protein
MTDPIRTILYATDLGEGSETVLEYAIGLAKQLRAKLHVVAVIEDEREKSAVEADPYVPKEALDHYQENQARRIREKIESQVAAYRAEHPHMYIRDPITEIKVRAGDDVADIILEEAKAMDLILLGSHGASAFKTLLVGSVAQKVTEKTRIPVLLVPIGS